MEILRPNKSKWKSAYKQWHPNLVADSIHQIIIDNSPKGKILNIGAGAREYDPLNFPYFREHEKEVELIGVNIAENQTGTYGNFSVVRANAHEIPFDHEYFDCIICNAMMEHDPKFWLTLSEVRRTLKTGGLFIAGTPGYVNKPLKKWIPFLPGFGSYKYDLSQATITYTVHDAPGDYYRFSEQAFRDVVFEGFENVNILTVMFPPRILGCGRKQSLKQVY